MSPASISLESSLIWWPEVILSTWSLAFWSAEVWTEGRVCAQRAVYPWARISGLLTLPFSDFPQHVKGNLQLLTDSEVLTQFVTVFFDLSLISLLLPNWMVVVFQITKPKSPSSLPFLRSISSVWNASPNIPIRTWLFQVFSLGLSFQWCSFRQRLETPVWLGILIFLIRTRELHFILFFYF